MFGRFESNLQSEMIGQLAMAQQQQAVQQQNSPHPVYTFMDSVTAFNRDMDNLVYGSICGIHQAFWQPIETSKAIGTGLAYAIRNPDEIGLAIWNGVKADFHTVTNPNAMGWERLKSTGALIFDAMGASATAKIGTQLAVRSIEASVHAAGKTSRTLWNTPLIEGMVSESAALQQNVLANLETSQTASRSSHFLTLVAQENRIAGEIALRRHILANLETSQTANQSTHFLTLVTREQQLAVQTVYSNEMATAAAATRTQGVGFFAESGTRRFTGLVSDASKPEVRVLLRSGKLNLPIEQTKKLLDILNGGRMDTISLKLTRQGEVRLITERAGVIDGYQRMSFEVDRMGAINKIVQTAFDDLNMLVRQKPGELKNNLYDVKHYGT
ncbi:MAG: hypothetical protein K0Q74_1479 [Gammaproteobacteria bacterium]|jgi:hypothetical protein|nr:hypothetical protein [Gammaproteobacteria bacterium]